MARYSSAEAKQFIEYIAPLIQREGFARGYSIVSVTISQAVIEGACGKSNLAKAPNFNHFGLKAGQAWMKAKKPAVNMKTGEYYNGQYVNINDWFRKYSSDIECIEGYYDFISTKRYENLRNAKTYRQFAEYLKTDGYATSPSYINTLCNVVQKYGLDRYDERNIQREWFPMYKGNTKSIVDALDSLGIDSSRHYRSAIYTANFTDAYTASGKQNTAMLDLLKQGNLIKP